MPNYDELSAFFDNLSNDLRKDWDLLVTYGSMSEWTRERKLNRMDEIGMILRVLGEGHACLTYRTPEQREPAPMIWLPRAKDEQDA